VVGSGELQELAVPNVRVVVVNFNGGDITLRCVDALRVTHFPRERLEIVVVDNGSTDGVTSILKERYPDVVVVESATNEGFARGCNLALGDLDGVDFVALINNDALVEPNWLEPLLAGFTHARVGAVCPKLLLNLYAHAVLLQPSELSELPDGRLVGARVDRLVVNGDDQTAMVRFDERFWDPDRESERPGRWSKGTASVWWEVESQSVVDAVTVHLRSPSSRTVCVGPPGAPLLVEVGAATTPVSFAIDATVRVINSAGGALYTGWFGGDRGFLEPDVGQYDEPTEVFSWCGGAVLLRSDYLREVGVFDPSYFLYYEDFDLSWRGRSAGWIYRYEPKSVVYHEHAYSSKAGSEFFNYWVNRNRRLTLVKSAPAGVAVRAVVGAVRLGPSGFWSFVRAVPSAIRDRRRLNRTRVVSRAAIASWTKVK